jgi:hypothetical protein
MCCVDLLVTARLKERVHSDFQLARNACWFARAAVGRQTPPHHVHLILLADDRTWLIPCVQHHLVKPSKPRGLIEARIFFIIRPDQALVVVRRVEMLSHELFLPSQASLPQHCESHKQTVVVNVWSDVKVTNAHVEGRASHTIHSLLTEQRHLDRMDRCSSPRAFDPAVAIDNLPPVCLLDRHMQPLPNLMQR